MRKIRAGQGRAEQSITWTDQFQTQHDPDSLLSIRQDREVDNTEHCTVGPVEEVAVGTLKGSLETWSLACPRPSLFINDSVPVPCYRLYLSTCYHPTLKNRL